MVQFNFYISYNYIKKCITFPIFCASGFWHEHKRPARDDYIKAVPCIDGRCRPENDDAICKDQAYAKVTALTFLDTYNTPYDYCSVMHYPNAGWEYLRGLRDYCGFNSKYPVSCVINTRLGPRSITRMGQKLGLSELDIIGINKRYGCKEDG